jgi:hypothetical protein
VINNNLDEEDAEFVRKAQECLLGRIYPSVGDAVLLPDGSIERIIYRFGSESNYYSQVQLDGGDVNGSYHLMFKGGVSYSGAGGNVYELNQLKKTAEVESVKFWIAHHDNLCGGCARDCMCDVNVWRVKD